MKDGSELQTANDGSECQTEDAALNAKLKMIKALNVVTEKIWRL